MKLRDLIFAGLLGLAVHPLQAGDIYRWVDDQGQTQVSDVLPEKYRDKATRINSKKYELTSEQKADARDRAVYEAQRARDENQMRSQAQYEAQVQDRERERERQYRTAQELARARAQTSQEAAVDGAKSQCEALWRRYNDGVACFSRFAAGNAGGGSVRIRSEAYQFCTDAPLPPSSCSLPAAR